MRLMFKDATLRVSPSPAASRQARVPDFCHVLNFVALKLHHVHVIRFDALACGRTRASLSSVGPAEDSVSGDVASLLICRKRFQVISAVGYEAEQPFHPVAILLKRSHLEERLRLGRKRCTWIAVRSTSVPSFPCLAGDEKRIGDFGDSCHGVNSENI